MEEQEVINVAEQDTKKVKVSKSELKKQQQEEKLNQAKERERTLIDSWKKIPNQDVIFQMDCYFDMHHYINKIIKGKSNGLIIVGKGGSGKTYAVLSKLKKAGITDYAYLDSFTTPASLYIWMYQNSDKIKILDDCFDLLRNPKCNAMLKASLWEAGGKRIVHYQTTKPLKDEDGEVVPNSFEETGSTIILTNEPHTENPNIKAVMTRVDNIELKISNVQMLKMMEEVIKLDYNGLNLDERKEVLEFIREKTSKSTSDFNLRTLIKAMDNYSYAKDINDREIWKRLVMRMLKKNDKQLLVEELENDESLKTVKEKVDKFIELMDGEGSKATYFRLKTQLGILNRNKEKKEDKAETKVEEKKEDESVTKSN